MWVSSHYRVTNDLSAEQVGRGPAVWHVLRHVGPQLPESGKREMSEQQEVPR